MKSRRLGMAAAVSMVIVAAFMLAMPVKAAGAETFVLNDDTTPADFTFSVESPGVTSLEADYLNMSVYSAPVTSGHGANATWYVRVSIYDGVTNYTWNKTLAVKNDLTVYSNISMADPGTTFVTNGTCVLTIQVQKADFSIADTVVGSFGVYATDVASAMMQFVPLIITVAIFAAIIPMLRKIGGKGKH